MQHKWNAAKHATQQHGHQIRKRITNECCGTNKSARSMKPHRCSRNSGGNDEEEQRHPRLLLHHQHHRRCGVLLWCVVVVCCCWVFTIYERKERKQWRMERREMNQEPRHKSTAALATTGPSGVAWQLCCTAAEMTCKVPEVGCCFLVVVGLLQRDAKQ